MNSTIVNATSEHGQSEQQSPLLEVDGLTIEVAGTRGRKLRIVEDVSFSIPRGTSVALVGESGSGKTVTSLALMGLSKATGTKIVSGSVRFAGQELVGAPESAWRKVRGKKIGMIFQQPMRSLNPAFTVGEQIAESARLHLGLSRKAAWARAVEMLDMVGIPRAAERAKDYPHAFSGGMSQRAMIAMVMVSEPELLIADEPTTALDVTVQAKILNLIADLQRESKVSVLFVSHDLGVVAEACQRLVVMYSGHIVERGWVDDVFFSPQHPYTAGLLGAIPRREASRTRRLKSIPGHLPIVGSMMQGCRFADRCEYVVDSRCRPVVPDLIVPATADVCSAVRCVRHGELTLSGMEES